MFSRKGKRSTAEVPVPTEAAELAPVEASEGKDDIQDEADALKDWAKKGLGLSRKFIKRAQSEGAAILASKPAEDEATEKAPETPLNGDPESVEDAPSKKFKFAKITRTAMLLRRSTLPSTDTPAVVEEAVVEEVVVTADVKVTTDVKSKEDEEQGHEQEHEQEEETSVKQPVHLSMLGRTAMYLKRSNKVAIPVAPAAPVEDQYEGIYIVLEPIEFKNAVGINKALREYRDEAELQRYILMQHWGIAVGDKYYHLHKNEDESLAISLVPFQKEHRTIKIPIWRTKLKHEDRVGMAMGVVKEMGALPDDQAVRIYEADEETPLSDEEKQLRHYSSTAYRKLRVPMYFKGKYNPLVNNCIAFVFRFLFGQLFRFRASISSGMFKAHLTWAIEKWRENGCKSSSEQITDKLSELFSPMKVIKSAKKVKTKVKNTSAAKVKEQISKTTAKVKANVTQGITHPLAIILLSFLNVEAPESKGEKSLEGLEESGKVNDDEVNVAVDGEEDPEGVDEEEDNEEEDDEEEGEEEEEEVEDEVEEEEEEEEEEVEVKENPLPVTA